MSSDWYAYKTKGGDTLFFYNTKTGKHIWANDCNGLQFEVINNEDHAENCALFKEKYQENPSDWRPYTLKSGDALFYYNIMTGEHKWNMNFDLSNSSSIPSEPVLLKYDIDSESTSDSSRIMDWNGNTIPPTAGHNRIKTETSDKETTIEEACCFAETEADIPYNPTTAIQPEHSLENQFERELDSSEMNSNFMALRSTVQRRTSISYASSTREASLQRDDINFEEYFSDTTSSSEDNCSNFSDELSEISASESEEEQVQVERTKKTNRRKSKYDVYVENLTGKFSSAQYSNSALKYPAQEQHSSSHFIQHEASLVKNSRRTNGDTTDQDKTASVANERILNRSEGCQVDELQHGRSLHQITSTFEQESAKGSNIVLLTRDEQEERSTGQNGMPKIGGIFSITKSSYQVLKKENFENYKESIDSTYLRIYDPESEPTLSNVGGNNWPMNQSRTCQRSCLLTGKNDNQFGMPTIEEVFSLRSPRNSTTELVVAKEGDQIIDSAILGIYQADCNFDYEASQLAYRKSVPQENANPVLLSRSEEEQELQKLCSETRFALRNHSSTAADSMAMAQSGKEHLESVKHISSPVKEKEGQQERESEDVSARRDVDDNVPIENTWGTDQTQTDKDCAQEDYETSASKPLECEAKKAANNSLASPMATLEKVQDQMKEGIDRNHHGEQFSCNNDHQDEESCTASRALDIQSSDESLPCAITIQEGPDHQDEESCTVSRALDIQSSDESLPCAITIQEGPDHQDEESCTVSRALDIQSSDESLPCAITIQEGPALDQKEHANPANMNSVYHYSETETVSPDCNNRRPAITVGSQYFIIRLPTTESVAPVIAVSIGDSRPPCVTAGNVSDPQIGTPIDSERNEELITLPAPAIKQEQPIETNHDIFRGQGIDTSMLPNSRCFANNDALQTSHDTASPTTELVAPVTAGSVGDSRPPCVTAGNVSDPQIGTPIDSERNEVPTTLPAPAIKQEQPIETNHDIFTGPVIDTSMLPNSRRFANDDALRQTSHDKASESGLRDHHSPLNGASYLSGFPTVVENVISRYKCCYCDKDFCLQEELQRHLALRHLLFGGVFLCNSCDDSFFSREEFSQHLLLHDEVKPVKCRHCETDFVTVEELASHISSHVDEPKYPKYSKRRRDLVGSTEENKNQEKTNVSEENEPEKRRRCTYCDRDFRHYFALRVHLRTHGKENNHKCLLCGKWYLDLKSLRKHAIIHLREKPLECDICHKTFRFHSDYLQHQIFHVPGQPFRCEKRGCTEIFDKWDDLRQHEIAIHEEKSYRCTKCEKLYSRKEKLIWHLRLHTGEKPLECKTCGRRFRTRVILRNHEKIHLDFKTFKCNVCDKGFKQKCSMLRHLKTHRAGPKEYPCNLCKKRFTQSCSLQRHLRIHSGEKFKCPKCPMKFLEAWRMRVHIKNDHSEE